MNSSLDWLSDELRSLDEAQLRRQLVSRAGSQGARIVVNGQRFLNFGSNDYLNLAADSRLKEAVERTVRRGGWGSGASPLVNGRSALHAELEKKLAAFEQTEAALLFPSGYAANVGTITALVGKGDYVFSDQKNHASIIDGCRLSGAQIEVYPHNDVTAVSSLLERTTDARRKLIVTDSLFSMDGDFARVSELARLAEQHRAMLMVDEAHATGVCGSSGSGVCEMLGVEAPIRIGTLSKALGSIGGFVAGSRSLIDWLTNRARPYVFSTALPAATAAAALAALGVIRDEPHRRRELLQQAAMLRDELRTQDWRVGGSNDASQIIPIIIGQPERALQISARLRDAECFVPCIRPPSVPSGESLLRISLTYGHSAADIEQLLNGFRSMR